VAEARREWRRERERRIVRVHRAVERARYDFACALLASLHGQFELAAALSIYLNTEPACHSETVTR